MRYATLLGLTTCALIASPMGTARAGSGKDAQAERIGVLVRQLGDEKFTKRDEASKELDAIGAPTLGALRKAAAGDDPEIRRRAERLVQVITGRMRAAAAQKELARWQGDWHGDEGQKLSIKDDRWISSTPTFGPVSGPLREIDVQEKMTWVDLVVEEGPTKGSTCKVILRLDRDTLYYCGTYGAVRPTEFKPGENFYFIAWKRGKGPPPPVAETQYEGAEISTDLPLAESKGSIHRVSMKCRLTDGGAGKLSLDPTVPKFDELGNRVAGGKPSPVVTLDCTLKFVKKGDGWRLFEIKGPKIVSRLSLIAYDDITPWGDARLLVHAKDGAVRYVVNLEVPQLRTKPCHPGCFPAGTLVHIPNGTKAIERIREGDEVIALDSKGKPVSAKVTGVFKTRNRLLTVRTEGGALVTTDTQPVALEAGGFRAAGELKPGDRVWRWVNGAKRAVKVIEVSAPDRETDVFNLILGEPTTFIAGNFLVRSKPPAVLPAPARAVSGIAVPRSRE